MAGMNYSQGEIEKKRLLALQRKQQTVISNDASSPRCSSNFSNNRTIANENKTANAHKFFRNGISKYDNSKKDIGYKYCKKSGIFNKQKERGDPISTLNFVGKTSRITGNCYMITDERFTLAVSYFPPLIEMFKTIPSKSYDIKSKNWNFLLKDYETLMEKIIQLRFDVQITGLPRAVIQAFRKNDTLTKVVENSDLSKIDPYLLDSLMPFQRDGICYGISKGGRCMIADDMGLGKTIQALGIAHYYRDNWPLLIVIPASVRYHWAEAIYTFLPSVPAQYVHQYTSTKDFLDNSHIVITTYDLLARAVDEFERKSFGFVVLDESHALKSAKTARFKAAQCVVSKARHVLLLSGTPALSRPIELYTQINLIMPNFMGYQEYGIRYCQGEKNAFGWSFTGSSNMQELQLLLKRTCVIRRLKTEVLNQLPSKKREVVMLDPDSIKSGTKEMTGMYEKLQRKVLTGIEGHSLLLQYYHKTSIAKQKGICDYVTNLFKEKQKCIVFAHHQNILDAICNVAQRMDIEYIRIDGKTNPERRKCEIDKFQNCDDCVAAILSITSANAGITLTAAQLVIFAELFWNPGILCQAEDRAHRIGQHKNVFIRYLVAKHTADDYLWPLIQRKVNVLNDVGLDQDFSLYDVYSTRHVLSSKQKTLDYFNCNDQKTEEGISRKNEKANVLSESQSSTIREEMEELLELSQEDFNFCDWDEVD